MSNKKDHEIEKPIIPSDEEFMEMVLANTKRDNYTKMLYPIIAVSALMGILIAILVYIR